MLYAVSWYLPLLLGTVLIYWLLGRIPLLQKLVLITASLLLLANLQPGFTAILAAWSLAVYVVGRRLRKRNSTQRLRLIVYSILALVGYMAFFKYLPGLLVTLLGAGQTDADRELFANAILPLGLSYFTFRFLHYVIDAYRGHLAAYSLVDFVLYSVFFPIIPAGPIERIEHFFDNATDGFDADQFSYGIQRILFGAGKKLLVVDTLLHGLISAPRFQAILSGDLGAADVGDVWAFLILSFLYAYLDFSSYSDLAIGTSRLFGYRIHENFNFPIVRRNLSEFWKNWHMTLSGWCTNYIYLPVLGRFRRPRLALYASMMTIGAWHQLNYNWLMWGALHATGLVVVMQWQRLARKRRVSFPGPPVMQHAMGTVMTFLFVSWVFAFVAISDPIAATRVFLFAATGLELP